jgi:hypothetical protein
MAQMRIDAEMVHSIPSPETYPSSYIPSCTFLFHGAAQGGTDADALGATTGPQQCRDDFEGEE